MLCTLIMDINSVNNICDYTCADIDVIMESSPKVLSKAGGILNKAYLLDSMSHTLCIRVHLIN